MTKKVYTSPLPYPFSKAVRAGDFVFVSGQMPTGPDGRVVQGSIEVQTRQVMENIKAILKEAGCEMSDIVKTTVWLEQERDFAGFNKAYAEFFANEQYPARATVGSTLMLDARLEIEAVAYKPPA